MYAALRSEKTKFFTFGWCVLGIIGATIIPLLFLIISDIPNIEGEKGVLYLCLQALYLGQLGIVIASAAYFGQEYSHSALRTTLLTQPSRKKVLFMKFLNVTLIVVFTGIVSSVLGLIVLSFQHDIEWTSALMLKLLGSVSLGILSWIQIAWIASTISIMTKSMITAISIMLPLIIGLGQMLFMLSESAKFLPTLATMNLFTIPEVTIYLDKWSGLVVQSSWAILLVAISAWLFLYRSVR
ncbi:ABC transporter permease [Metabacillus malikii]|uniref:ABC-type transport system involved in multi-copper enzyme maturation permease subunit n=1 Tax=Metabacillus malikii TaxID=1504265 RepID=A0ABT9ZKR6_9BACI|nr:ABC transporter permease [Metabacillus malikii]MDQ0232891.1 ABC-type transport system involved in multi-copper enzyme maturation permease subunit [Metabacillus malikii]